MRLGKWLFGQRKKKSQMIAYYQDVFVRTGPSGKYVLADLARHGFLDQNTFVPGDTHGTAFNEGRRAVILHILNTLELNPNEFMDQYHFAGNLVKAGGNSDVFESLDD